MATEIHHHNDPDVHTHSDYSALVWMALIALFVIVLGYLAFASYDRTDTVVPSTTINNTTDGVGTTVPNRTLPSAPDTTAPDRTTTSPTVD